MSMVKIDVDPPIKNVTALRKLGKANMQALCDKYPDFKCKPKWNVKELGDHLAAHIAFESSGRGRPKAKPKSPKAKAKNPKAKPKAKPAPKSPSTKCKDELADMNQKYRDEYQYSSTLLNQIANLQHDLRILNTKLKECEERKGGARASPPKSGRGWTELIAALKTAFSGLPYSNKTYRMLIKYFHPDKCLNAESASGISEEDKTFFDSIGITQIIKITMDFVKKTNDLELCTQLTKEINNWKTYGK
jgi:hypothetical protein